MNAHAIRFRKLPSRAQTIVFPLLLSFVMSGIVSAIATVRAIGLTEDLIFRILQSWSLSYAVAFPTALAAVPLVRRLVGMIVETPR
ncbi:DUF2798 domain-containing protein [Microvirga rosea]|uniref:DUF2798 domain-containing protein n=1 Tax=Microvirga rosea TaxID=2715425 RepID=UPI001D09E541|nr:DUF2798 domain-containing protein [Microvirga rosea]MCB8823272.1 DUF2798 domain-containing protein [Microvirga rosea]